MKINELYPGIAPAEDGLVYLEVRDTPRIRLTGLLWKDKNKNYHRMDDEFTEEYNPGIKRRSAHTAGVQASFRTDSEKIGVHMVLDDPEYMNHMPDNAVGGADIYIGSGTEKRYWHVIWNDRKGDFVQTELTDRCVHDYTVNFPLYSGLKSFRIGLCPDAEISEPEPFAVEKPVIFYGSSITQGGCASHPGNNYINILSRLLNINTVDLGFSGSCLGEPMIAKLIAQHDAAAFVMDYDHNASGAEHLSQTHENFFRLYRAERPDTPVIILTKPDYDDNPADGEARKKVIYKTDENAIRSGDKNVYFIDGSKIFREHLRDCCTVDRNHPTDLGFARIADAVFPVLKKCLCL